MATRSRGRSQRRSQRRSKSQRGGGMEGIRSNGAPTGGMDISNVIKNIVENKDCSLAGLSIGDLSTLEESAIFFSRFLFLYFVFIKLTTPHFVFKSLPLITC